jgi:hypothetical protein
MTGSVQWNEDARRGREKKKATKRVCSWVGHCWSSAPPGRPQRDNGNSASMHMPQHNCHYQSSHAFLLL